MDGSMKYNYYPYNHLEFVNFDYRIFQRRTKNTNRNWKKRR